MSCNKVNSYSSWAKLTLSWLYFSILSQSYSQKESKETKHKHAKCATLLSWRHASQGGGGVTDSGGVQGMFGHCVEGHGLVRTIGDGWMVGLGDPMGLFQPWWFYDSMEPLESSVSLPLIACCRGFPKQWGTASSMETVRSAVGCGSLQLRWGNSLPAG